MNLLLQDYGLMVRRGTIVDATIIEAPSSTKNAEGVRDLEMHQAKKGNNYFFGMKAHIGVDLHTGLVHAVVGTPANVADVTQVDGLLHGDEELVFGDAGYQGGTSAKNIRAVRCSGSWRCVRASSRRSSAAWPMRKPRSST